MKCDRCNGIGIIKQKVELIEYVHNGVSHKMPGNVEKEFCDKCLGSGELDWIEAIVGKKTKPKDFLKLWSEEAATSLANSIDTEILEKIKNEM